jgi:quinol monooxygenase YgiN
MKNNSKQVTVVITCAIKPGKLDMAKRELEAVIKTVMANETACRGVCVHVEQQNPQRMLIIEHWESKDVFTGPHMQTAHMQTFMKTAESFVDGEPTFSFWREIIAAP